VRGLERNCRDSLYDADRPLNFRRGDKEEVRTHQFKNEQRRSSVMQ
jgi:hypothetical protein